MDLVVAGSNPVIHPKAPVAHLDRVTDFESVGSPFESGRAHTEKLAGAYTNMKKYLKSWALVLSGGGARGLTHIGILKGLEEAGFPEPSLLAGTSMGAIVGGLYACGMSAAELARFAIEDFNIADYMDSFVFRINGPVGKVFQTGQMLASLAASTGIDPGNKLLELFQNLTGGKSFEETRIPFRCNAVDLFRGREAVFETGSVAKAMRASMSFPLFFEPFFYEGMCLVDGGIINNIPVSIPKALGYKHILAVNVNRFDVIDAGALKNGPQIIYRSLESVLNASRTDKISRAEMIMDATDKATPFSFFRKKEFIELGEEMVRRNLDSLETFFRPRLGTFRKTLVCGL